MAENFTDRITEALADVDDTHDRLVNDTGPNDSEDRDAYIGALMNLAGAVRDCVTLPNDSAAYRRYCIARALAEQAASNANNERVRARVLAEQAHDARTRWERAVAAKRTQEREENT